MSVTRTVRKSSSSMMTPDPARLRRALTTPQRNFLNWGKVGYIDALTTLPEPTPNFVRIENGQVLVECTVEPSGDKIVARLGLDGAGEGFGEYTPLTFGCRVVIEFIKGNPGNAVITARVHDGNCRMPDDVAGVITGAVASPVRGVPAPAPMWKFIKLGIGQLLAIETQAGGDILMHSAGQVEIKCGDLPTDGIHLNGTTHLGAAPVTPPVGATSGPAGETIPGVPAVAFVPIPATPSTPAPPNTIAPYVGNADGIIRAKDGVQSTAAVDPAFWTWILAVHAHPLIGPIIGVPPPIALHSEHSGRNGPGSGHTASD